MKRQLLFTAISFIAIFYFGTMTPGYGQSGLVTSFGTDGEVTTNFGVGFAQGRKVIELDNGKLLVIGDFETSGDFESNIVVAKYNADGSLDTTFGTDGTASLQINSLDTSSDDAILDASGRILIVAFTSDGSGGETTYLLRLTSNGTLDSSFGTNGLAEITFDSTTGSFASTLIVQPDGNIIVAGATITPDGMGNELGDFGLARYTASGVLDTTFGNSGNAVTDFDSDRLDAIFSINLQPDGKIVAVGNSFDDAQDDEDVVAARYNADGSLDSSFGTSGLSIIDFINQATFIVDSELQSDGKIVMVGDVFDDNSDEFLLIRLNADGNADSSFDTGGIVTTNFLGSADAIQEAVAVNITSDGKIIVSGDVANTNTSADFVGIARYLTDGSLDTAFRDDGRFLYQSSSTFLGDALITSSGDLLVTGSKGNTDGTNSFDELYLAKFLLTNTLGLDDIIGNTIRIYPNPASDNLYLNFGDAQLDTEVTIYNVLGKQVLSLNTDGLSESLDISKLSNGTYLIKVTQNENSTTQKIIKE